jgi:hypothetical protein
MLGAAETVIGQTEKFQASREFRGFYHLAAKANSVKPAERRLVG